MERFLDLSAYCIHRTLSGACRAAFAQERINVEPLKLLALACRAPSFTDMGNILIPEIPDGADHRVRSRFSKAAEGCIGYGI